MALIRVTPAKAGVQSVSCGNSGISRLAALDSGVRRNDGRRPKTKGRRKSGALLQIR